MGHWAICTTVIGSFLLLISNKINIDSKSLYFWLSFIVHQVFSFVFCLCQLFLFLLCYLSILLAVSLAVLHLLRLPSKKEKKKYFMSWTTKAVKHISKLVYQWSGLLHWWLFFFFRNTLSSKYWQILLCDLSSMGEFSNAFHILNVYVLKTLN